MKILELNLNLSIHHYYLRKKYNKSNLKKINLLNTPDLYQPIKCTLYAKKINAVVQGTNNLKNIKKAVVLKQLIVN